MLQLLLLVVVHNHLCLRCWSLHQLLQFQQVEGFQVLVSAR
jgi:hypothetical protein